MKHAITALILSLFCIVASVADDKTAAIGHWHEDPVYDISGDLYLQADGKLRWTNTKKGESQPYRELTGTYRFEKGALVTEGQVGGKIWETKLTKDTLTITYGSYPDGRPNTHTFKRVAEAK